MKFLRSHWYDLGIIPLIVSVICLVAFWGEMSVLRRLALLNFVVIFWHQFEEYRFPGGEPAITNLAMQPKSDTAQDRYPLNQNNAMVMNLVAAWVCYLLPVIFPDVLWLGFMPVLFGISQVVIHVFQTPRRIGNHVYSPGACAVVFGHLPVGLYWFYYTISTGLLQWTDVVFGLVYQVLFIAIFMLRIGYGVLSKEDSKYPFPKEEFERGGYAERIRRVRSGV